MKNKILSLLILSLLALAGTASAQMGMMGTAYRNGNAVSPSEHPELNDALQDIYEVQAIDNQAQIDCSQVTDDQFEKLGDAYMGLMLPNEKQHTVMDTMMGGEGSESLRLAHINMGRSYLGCWSNYSSGPVYMPMLGGFGMMGGSGQGLFSGIPMMAGGYGIVSMFLITIWAILALVGLLAFIKWAISVSKKQE